MGSKAFPPRHPPICLFLPKLLLDTSWTRLLSGFDSGGKLNNWPASEWQESSCAGSGYQTSGLGIAGNIYLGKVNICGSVHKIKHNVELCVSGILRIIWVQMCVQGPDVRATLMAGLLGLNGCEIRGDGGDQRPLQASSASHLPLCTCLKSSFLSFRAFCIMCGMFPAPN